MAEYYNISKEEMETFLLAQGFSKITLPNTVELVYGKRIDKNGIPLSLRVYTGISPSGESRDVGADAIRANLFFRTPAGEVKKIADTKRVHRVKNWKKNLQIRIQELLEHIPVICDRCGSPMMLRQGVSKKTNKPYSFYGCTGYPSCTNTRPNLEAKS